MPYKIPDDAPVMIAKGEIEGLAKTLETAETDRDFYVNEAARLQAERDTLAVQTGELAALNATLAKDSADAKALIAALRKDIERLQSMPTTSWKRVPVISRDVFENVAGVTIENSLVSPDTPQYDRVRLNLMLIAGMGFNTARWSMNALEVKRHVSLPETNIAHLPGFANSLGIVYGADTVDRYVWDTLKAEAAAQDATVKAGLAAALKAYLLGLAKWAKYFYFNDANQYTGTTFPKDTLTTMVQRVREIVPEMPLIASLTANAVTADYSMFDHVEAQTFGTVNEFKTFLSRPFDVWCLDGRKSVTAAYLKEIAAPFLTARKEAFFFYPTTVSDWLVMPAQMTAIRELVAKWHTIH